MMKLAGPQWLGGYISGCVGGVGEGGAVWG